MAQPGNFTPILIYGSSTSTNVPLAANLTNSATGSEIAINVADKNLFFKDSSGVVNTVPIRQSGTSSNGWLSSTDWNTFNGKAPATSGTSLLYGNGSGGFSNVTIGTGITFAGGTLSATGSGGTVTSVTGTSPVVSSGGTTPAISLATAYGDTLNPYASKTANYVLASPSGSAGVPSFRALVAADLPSLSGTYIPYTGASSAIDLNAQTVTNIAHLGINTTSVPDILLRAFGDNNSASRIAIRGYSSNASSSSMRVAKFRGTYAAPQAPLSGDSLGKFELAGYGTTSANGYPQASYEGVATENWGATARGAKALFYVTPNTTITQAVALTIDQDKSATFASTVTATSFSGSGSNLTGVVTSVTGTSPVVSSGGQTPAISMPAATTSVSGYLTSTDWNTFNNKGSGTVTSVSGTTGRITSTGGTTPVIDLASGVATAGTTGSSSLIPVVTIDTYGRVTSITTAANPQGTVTSVTGTAPVVSSGGATPAISMAAATGSVNGYLTSTDWTTFNNKGSGTVTSVAALTLGTTGTDLSSTVANGTTTPVITLQVPTASATNRGALSAADWATFNGKQAALVSGTNIKTVGGVSLLGSGDAGTIGVGYGGTGTATAFTAGSVPFAGASGVYSQDNANLFWDNTNKRLGIGTSSPASTLNVSNSANSATSITVTNSNGGASAIANAKFTNGTSTGEFGQLPTAFGGYGVLTADATYIYAGNNRPLQFSTDNNYIAFGAGPGATERMRIDSSGGVLINKTANARSAMLEITGSGTYPAGISTNVSAAGNPNYEGRFTSASGTAYFGYYIYNGSAVGQITSTGSVTLFTSLSDQRLKENIVDAGSGLAKLANIKVRSFDWKTNQEKTDFGLIAQELNNNAPECVVAGVDKEDGSIDKPWQIDASPLIPAMIKAIQELSNKFDAYVASHP